MGKPTLSICIPTYNRAEFLGECLESLALLDAGYWEDVEVIVSDNASTDNTREVVDRFRRTLPLRYFRNERNIGAEPNYFAAASYALAEYVWIFGDDDVFEEAAVASALQNIHQGYDLIVLNFSIWSRKMDIEVCSSGLPRATFGTYGDPNAVLASLGSHLGYISSVILKREIFFSVPPEEHEPFAQNLFTNMYSIYRGIRSGTRVICLPDPVFMRRAENSDFFMGETALYKWNKTFIEGTAQIFEALGHKGYSICAVVRAKNQVLRDFVIWQILAGMKGVDRPRLLRYMCRHYQWNWRFWVICFPALLMPRSFLSFARERYRAVRSIVRSYCRA